MADTKDTELAPEDLDKVAGGVGHGALADGGHSLADGGHSILDGFHGGSNTK